MTTLEQTEALSIFFKEYHRYMASTDSKILAKAKANLYLEDDAPSVKLSLYTYNKVCKTENIPLSDILLFKDKEKEANRESFLYYAFLSFEKEAYCQMRKMLVADLDYYFHTRKIADTPIQLFRVIKTSPHHLNTLMYFNVGKGVYYNIAFKDAFAIIYEDDTTEIAREDFFSYTGNMLAEKIISHYKEHHTEE